MQRSRRPRLEDVAAETGVSTATVSLVLRSRPGPSDATRELVLAAASRLGYRPDRAASMLASHRSRVLGVMMDIRNPFHAQLIEDIHESADRHGYNLVLSTVTRSHDEARAIETLLDSRCEALVLLGPQAPTQRLDALSRQLPVVVVGRPVPNAGVDVVRTDDNEGLAQSVAHLVGLGHRSIAYIDGGSGTVSTLRRRAYQRAMRRHQLVNNIQVIPGGETETAGADAAPALLKARSEVATAVLTFNDRCAIGLIDALVKARIDVPASLSIVGYDDSPVAKLPHINLTTVSQDTAAISEHAITALIERLDDERVESQDIVVPTHLIIRGTTAPATGPR